MTRVSTSLPLDAVKIVHVPGFSVASVTTPPRTVPVPAPASTCALPQWLKAEHGAVSETIYPVAPRKRARAAGSRVFVQGPATSKCVVVPYLQRRRVEERTGHLLLPCQLSKHNSPFYFNMWHNSPPRTYLGPLPVAQNRMVDLQTLYHPCMPGHLDHRLEDLSTQGSCEHFLPNPLPLIPACSDLADSPSVMALRASQSLHTSSKCAPPSGVPCPMVAVFHFFPRATHIRVPHGIPPAARLPLS